MSFIYKTTNKINGKIYIGKSKYNKSAYLGSGLKLKYAINKYGTDNFEKTIIEECDDKIVSAREIFWINEFNSTDDSIGYNISKGGQGGAHFWDTMTESERELHCKKISDGRKGVLLGPRTTITKQKQSDSFNKYIKDNPTFLRERGLKKCKTYYCVDCKNNVLYITQNLKEFCLTHNLDLGAMQHNARSRKKQCNKNWYCCYHIFDRIALTDSDIIKLITEEYMTNNKIYRDKIRKARTNAKL
jgi:group I intron endonuclease